MKNSLLIYRTCLRMLLPAMLVLVFATVNAQTVSVWITKGDQSAKLQQQASVNFATGGSNQSTITINDQSTFQSVDGFGFALTQGSAQALMQLNATTRNALLSELFHSTSGNAISVVRISIGASDLSNSTYTYNETPGDVNMNNFSLAGPDQTYLIPVLQSILAINPNIKVLATPWTAPTWMKTNGAWIGGSLSTTYYAAYSNYFIKYLDTMAALGINVWAITPQNEPENPYNEPSMLMNSTEQKNFINNHLGPAIAASSHATKIIVFDHNCDNTTYPIDVLNNSPYSVGAAFHLYAGSISAMSTVKNATGKDVYFTEQFTSSNGNFGGDLSWHMQNVVIGSLRNWSKTVVEWNLATDTNFGPRTPGGCTECLGAITVTGASTFTRNVSYYIISQISKFVKPGAIRVESNLVSAIQNVAFKNPDGSMVVLVYNTSSKPSETFSVAMSGGSFSYTLPKSTAATFIWTPSGSGGQATSLHVASIVTGTQSAAQGKKKGKATVIIENNLNLPAAQATVTGTFSGTFSESVNGVTDSNGVVTFTTTGSIKGTPVVNFCVDQVTHATLSYNSGENEVTCASGTARLGEWKPDSDGELIVYPNPIVSGVLFIDLPENEGSNSRITLTDLSGRIVLSSDLVVGKNQLTLAPNLNRGVYLLKISLSSGDRVERVLME